MKKPIVELLFEKAQHFAEINSSLEKWAESMGVHLYSNQVKIIETICGGDAHNINILAARSSGKTYSVALATVKLCMDNPNYSVLCFAPKIQQSTRILDQIVQILNSCKDTLFKEVEWNYTNKAYMRFKNGSWIQCLGSQSDNVEGWHAECLLLDEAQAIDTDFFNTKALPMAKAAHQNLYRLIKIGIPRRSVGTHFYDSCNNPAYTTLVFDWTKCDNLKNAGITIIDGKEYPTTILKDMPIEMKKEMFPDHPEWHIPSENNMSVEDFKEQYSMEWVDSNSRFLTRDDIEAMIGEHSYQMQGRDGEEYYFGLDLAGGLLINQGLGRDYSSLTIISKDKDGMKRVVHCEEWQGDIVEQMEEIISWIHPETGRFKCVFGTADYGSLGPAVVDMLLHSGLPIAGIRYRSSEPTTGMPYKTAIFDNLFTELRSGYFKYPCHDDLARNYLLKKHFDEWEALERKVNSNGNVRIAAPENTLIHDDCCNSCSLAVWAADKMKEELRRIQRRGMLQNLLTPNISAATTANRFNRNNLHMPAGLGKMLGNGGWRKQ